LDVSVQNKIMKVFQLFLLFVFGINFLQCQSVPAIDDLSIIPEVTEADKKYANVYKILDGTWKGQFKIYTDSKRKQKKAIDLKNIGLKNLEKKGLTLNSTIEVEQIYTSVTPYFQRVLITDFYPESGQKVVAKGVNKVENGQLLCVVIKPDDTVIHDGYLESRNTIIWQRALKTPQKVEYFRETVDEKFYEIIGWGYYSEDNLSLSPPFWFHGKYERVE